MNIRVVKNSRHGFSLLELLIVVSIFAIMTVILLANQRRFGGAMDINNLAYDIALSIREAQTYGVAVKGVSGAPVQEFMNSFGVHFEANDSQDYKIFADVKPSSTGNPDNRYRSEEDITVKNYSLKNNYKIIAICAVSSSGENCPPSGRSTLDIVFKRPDPDATITFWGNGNNSTRVNHARIKIQSADGKIKGIDVMSTGQIAVVDAT